MRRVECKLIKVVVFLAVIFSAGLPTTLAVDYYAWYGGNWGSVASSSSMYPPAIGTWAYMIYPNWYNASVLPGPSDTCEISNTSDSSILTVASSTTANIDRLTMGSSGTNGDNDHMVINGTLDLNNPGGPGYNGLYYGNSSWPTTKASSLTQVNSGAVFDVGQVKVINQNAASVNTIQQVDGSVTITNITLNTSQFNYQLQGGTLNLTGSVTGTNMTLNIAGGVLVMSNYSVFTGLVDNGCIRANDISVTPANMSLLLTEDSVTYPGKVAISFNLDALNYSWIPSPIDGAVDVALDVDLSWSVGQNAISHDIYFGTSESAVANAQRREGDVNGDRSVDITDLSILVSQWLTDPGNTSLSADIQLNGNVDLNDFAALAATWHLAPDVAFKASQTTATFDPGALMPGTTYYWRIDEVNPSESDSPWTTGSVWSFTTKEDVPPAAASNTFPIDGNSDVSIRTQLSWVTGAGATSHDVYFSPSNPPTFIRNQPETTYDPGTLDYDTTYYWRIDEVNDYGTTTGTTWSFTTGQYVTYIMPLGDSITQGNEGASSYEWYSYRYYLWNQLQDNGYTNVNFVGSHDVLAYDRVDSRDFDKDHEGHGGWTTGQILTGGPVAGGTGNLTIWLDGLELIGQLPDIVLMHLGTNDSGNTDQSGTITAMKDIIDLLRAYNPNVKILLAKIIPYPTNEVNIDALNALIVSQMDGYETPSSEVIIVDQNTDFLTSWLDDDIHLHPKEDGAIFMADQWYDALVPLL